MMSQSVLEKSSAVTKGLLRLCGRTKNAPGVQKCGAARFRWRVARSRTRATQTATGGHLCHPRESVRDTEHSFSGEGGIRTLVTLAGKSVFETDAFNHSATSPNTDFSGLSALPCPSRLLSFTPLTPASVHSCSRWRSPRERRHRQTRSRGGDAWLSLAVRAARVKSPIVPGAGVG